MMLIFHVGRTKIQKSIQFIKQQTGMAGLHSSDFTRKHCSLPVVIWPSFWSHKSKPGPVAPFGI